MKEEETEGRICGIYVDPEGKAGVLKGEFSGKNYRSIGMLKADGSVYIEPKEDSNISPEDLLDNINVGCFWAKLYGGFGQSGENGEIKGSGAGKTAFISSADWGIFILSLGLDSFFSNPENELMAKIGGRGEFEEGILGYWIADLNAQWEERRIKGPIDGRFISMTKEGEIKGDLIGVYFDQGTWEALSLGEWYKSHDLSYASYVKNDIFLHFLLIPLNKQALWKL